MKEFISRNWKWIICFAFLTGVALFLYVNNTSQPKLFQVVASKHSGIHFINKIVETDSINPIDVTNIYNGGGVGVGDFNNDGLQDIYFTGNMVSNKLYLNEGKLKFKEITEEAQVNGNGQWCRGVSVIDINNDGWLDIYVCATMDNNPEKRKNLLYINQGLNNNKIPVFKEMASAYGLADESHSTMAAFFDYDNDGDLDMYLVVNEIPKHINPSVFKAKITDGSFPSTGQLYRNDMDTILKHPVFTNVTKQAGVTIEGFGHGVNIVDINKDGWKDIFVTNDFIANDLLYINNQDGTFTDKAASYFKHTAANGMGQDVIDINNDGLPDIIELDMNPEDNYRKKMMLPPSSYQTFQLNDYFKYQYQYVRNILQINQGPRVLANDTIGDPIFSDVGYIAGITETDWSWCPLVADFNNDGLRDLVVTNGFPKDITDRDFIAYRLESAPITTQQNTLAQIPEVKLHNYAFQNTGSCMFEDVSKTWGLNEITFSNGAVFADLDNDGDLDLIINNINEEALVYENKTKQLHPTNSNYLTVKLNGDTNNINGIGTWVELYYNNTLQVYEQTPYRGYLSSIQLNPHFGLNKVSQIDSVVVKWPDGIKQTLKHVATNQTISINKNEAKERYSWSPSLLEQNTLFKEVTKALGIQYKHKQMDYIDFNIQKLLPHKFSEYGPSLAAGDLNGDGLDDIIVGGNSFYGAVVLMQQADGTFTQKTLIPTTEKFGINYQDMGMILFDVDNDGDLDLYIARGGYEAKPNSVSYQDQFYINDGHGNFTLNNAVIPENFTSKSSVRVFDYDKDGDLDLFIAGRVEPWNYPKPVSSFIYKNESKDGVIKFIDVTNQVAKELQNIGLVSDAIVTDFDNDTWPDLVLVGEWMAPTFLKNENGVFKNITKNSNLSGKIGWWNSIASGDFDNDGDIDYILGNFGMNSYYKASKQHPIAIYAGHFDPNESYDAFISLYLPESQENLTKKEYPAHGRDDVIKQMISLRSKFQNYKAFAKATIDQLLTPEQLKKALILKANNFKSSYIENLGNGKFNITELPFQAQLSTLNGMVVDDFDGDNNLDIICNTNDYGIDVNVGQNNALNGLLLKGDGKGNFSPLSILQSGIFIPGNGKALVKLQSKSGTYLMAASQNRDDLKVFQLKNEIKNIPVQPNEMYAEIIFDDGKKQRQEFYYGFSFLSQSARFLSIDKQVKTVIIYDNKGKTRTLNNSNFK